MTKHDVTNSPEIQFTKRLKELIDQKAPNFGPWFVNCAHVFPVAYFGGATEKLTVSIDGSLYVTPIGRLATAAADELERLYAKDPTKRASIGVVADVSIRCLPGRHFLDSSCRWEVTFKHGAKFESSTNPCNEVYLGAPTVDRLQLGEFRKLADEPALELQGGLMLVAGLNWVEPAAIKQIEVRQSYCDQPFFVALLVGDRWLRLPDSSKSEAANLAATIAKHRAQALERLGAKQKASAPEPTDLGRGILIDASRVTRVAIHTTVQRAIMEVTLNPKDAVFLDFDSEDSARAHARSLGYA